MGNEKIKIDETGNTYSRLTVVSEAESRWNKAMWNCQCECGNTSIVSTGDLRSGHTKSCGCLSSDITKERNTTHSMSKTPTYKVWVDMKSRCNNINDTAYSRYGGRGIGVCDRWDDSFESFYQDVGERPIGLTIDRIDNNGNYSPDNCKWSTRFEQSINRSVARWITFNGITKTAIEWSRTLGGSRSLISNRLDRYGWSIERALTTPLRGAV